MDAPTTLEIWLTKQQLEALEQLVRWGLHGSTVDEVAEYLVTSGLLQLWRDGMLEIPKPAKR